MTAFEQSRVTNARIALPLSAIRALTMSPSGTPPTRRTSSPTRRTSPPTPSASEVLASDGLLTRKRVAELLGMTENAICAAHWRGTFPLKVVRLGRNVRYRACDVRALIRDGAKLHEVRRQKKKRAG